MQFQAGDAVHRKVTRAKSVTAATCVSKVRKVSVESVEEKVHLEYKDPQDCLALSEKSDFQDFQLVCHVAATF